MEKLIDFKTSIKKDLIDHYDITISDIDLEAQTLLIPLQNCDSTQTPNNSKIEDIFKHYKKLIDLVEKVLDSNMIDINNYEINENTNEIDKDAIKKNAIRNYLLYFKNNQLIHELKQNSIIGYLFIYNKYIDLNMTDYIK
jgi:hypothetical protein